MGRAVRWSGWCLALFWVWLFYNGQWTHVELIAAGCAGAIGATAAEVARSRGVSAGLRFRSQHLRRVWAPLWQIFPQFAIVAFEAVALLVRRRTGGFAAVPTLGASGSDDPVGRGERVFLAYFDTLSPNDYVVDVDRRRKLALRHIFVREHETELP